MPRNNPLNRLSRMRQTLTNLIDLLDTSDVYKDLPDAKEWLDSLKSLDSSLTRREENPGLSVVVFAGKSGTGKSTLINAMCGEELAQTGAHRPTTKRITVFAHPETDTTSVEAYLGLKYAWIPASELDSHILTVEIPDLELCPQLRDAGESIMAQADILVFTSDSQKYADADFLEDLQQFSHPENTVVVLSHMDRVSPAEEPEVKAEFQRICSQLGLEPIVWTARLREDLSLADICEKLRDLAQAPQARWRGMHAALSREAKGLNTRADLPTALLAQLPLSADISSTPAAQKLLQTVAKASGADIVAREAEEAYLAEATYWMLFPPLNWLAGVRPAQKKTVNAPESVTEVTREAAPSDASPNDLPPADASSADASSSSVSFGEAVSDGVSSNVASSSSAAPSEEETERNDAITVLNDQVNPGEIRAAANAYASELSLEAPRLWQDFLHLRADRLAENLTSSLNLGIASWSAPLPRRRVWWKLWWCMHWVWLVALVVGSIWSLVWVAFLLAGEPIPVSSPLLTWLGPALLVGGIAGCVGWSLGGMKASGCAAATFGQGTRAKFCQLTDTITGKAFLDPLNQNSLLYPQLTELADQLSGI